MNMVIQLNDNVKTIVDCSRVQAVAMSQTLNQLSARIIFDSGCSAEIDYTCKEQLEVDKELIFKAMRAYE
jgi:hypothetical protein